MTHPARLLLVTATLLLAGAAQALAGVSFAPRAAAMHAGNGALGFALNHLPPELVLLFSHERETNLAKAKRRAELHLIDFVELMWPIVEREQPFVRGWVQEAICQHLEAVTDGVITNLLGNVPPGSTKSYLVNVFWPAWEWGPRNRPDLRYMSWSYDPRLTEEANDQCRKIIESEVYQRFWGDRFEILDDTDAKSYYKNDKGGWRRSSSIRGGGTGYRADRLIWDDPISVKQADSPAALKEATRWFARTLPTRVRNASGGISKVKVPYWVREVHGMNLEDDPDDGTRKATISATVGIMQRLHPHDISGIILKNPELGYEILLIEMRYKGDQHPARKLPTWKPSSIGYRDPRMKIGELADPIRFDEAAIAKLEAQLASEGLGRDAIAAQLDQWPVEGTGAKFDPNKLKIIEPHEAPTLTAADWRGWDWAGGEGPQADRTASARIRRGTDARFYLVHTAAQRGGPAKTDAFIKTQHRDDPPGVRWSLPKDPGGTSIHFNAYVARELCPGRTVTSSREEGDKEHRFGPVASQIDQDNFVIVRHPGCEIARAEMIDFPWGDHDDIVDGVSRAFMEHVRRPVKHAPDGGESGYA
jgi:predicted phage terminase large subunit-like protein